MPAQLSTNTAILALCLGVLYLACCLLDAWCQRGPRKPRA